MELKELTDKELGDIRSPRAYYGHLIVAGLDILEILQPNKQGYKVLYGISQKRGGKNGVEGN